MSEVTIKPPHGARRFSSQTDSGVISDSSDKFDPWSLCPKELAKEKIRGGSEVEQAHNSSASSGGDNCEQQETEKEIAEGKNLCTELEITKCSSIHRLLIVCNDVKRCSDITGASWPHVTVVNYAYESSTLDSISAQVAEALKGKQVKSVAFVLYNQQDAIHICGAGEVQTLTPISIHKQLAVRRFFNNIVTNHIDVEDSDTRMDILGCTALMTADLQKVKRELQNLTGGQWPCHLTYTQIYLSMGLFGVPVGMTRTVLGNELAAGPNQAPGDVKMHILDLYCESEKLKRPHPQTLAEFEKIHIVGKGAYGTAVLYRKKDDDSLVILKEINMHELNHIERQRALNEVKVLSMLDHPNIINYYDSFEEDGLLMIEMEYAEGGTLAQKSAVLSLQDRELEELEILNLFHQIVAAICYLHEHSVLHRDLKTANLFLTKEGEVKLGDFGVAKVMMTGSEAHSILGTPYYISPEICEGKCHNDKSDIWSLGCILYEMACRQRTFEGTNLPAVVNKIMKGQFAPITDNYSAEFKALVLDMLQKETQYRPSAHELLYSRLPEIMAKYEATPIEEEEPGTGVQCGLTHKRNGRTALYYFCMSDRQLFPIEGLPAKIKIGQIAVSDKHMIAVTAERAVYTWGINLKGQLGHGDLQSRSRPQLVEALKGKFIARACAGEGFSVFVSDNGIAMTSGDGAQGCLGHGDLFSTSRPCLIEALLGVNVQVIACGRHHVICVSGDGEVFSWGCGKFGKLGLGNEVNSCLPMKITFEEQIFVKDVKCGLDGTMFLTGIGGPLACGNNQYNKLGLNERRGLLMQMTTLFARTDVEGRSVPTLVKALRNQRVRDAVLGPTHTIVLVEPGNVYTFGRNTEGQLGTGNTKPYKVPVHVKQLLHKTITSYMADILPFGFALCSFSAFILSVHLRIVNIELMDYDINLNERRKWQMISCGETFSVAGTDDNNILFWGTKSKSVLAPNASSAVTVYQASASASAASPPPVETAKPLPGTASHKQSEKHGENEKQLVGISTGKPPDDDKLKAPEPPHSQVVFDSLSFYYLKDNNWSKAASLDERMMSIKGQRKTLRDQLETIPGNIRSDCKNLQESASSKPNTFGSENSLQEGESSHLVPVAIVSLKQNLQDHADVCAPCLRSIVCNRESIYVLVEGTGPPCHRPARKYRSFRKRGNRDNPALKQGRTLHYSHSSNEAGDEYTSSEMSELETSNFIPTWIRNELKDAVPMEARGDERGNETAAIATSARATAAQWGPTSKISTEGTIAPAKKEGVVALKKTSGKTSGSSAKHSNASTSGSSDGHPISTKPQIARDKDGRGEPVQDFSVSASQRGHYQTEMDVGSISTQICSNPGATCGRNISNSPWKPGLLNSPGTGNQKSLNRLRVGRGRGKSRGVWLNSEASVLKSSKYPHHPSHTTAPLPKNKGTNLTGEVKRKQTPDDIIQSQEKNCTSLYLLEQRLALEREARLQMEINKLHNELREQKQLLLENHDVMRQLQDQLLKVQSQQFRSNIQAERGCAIKSTAKPESKVCVEYNQVQQIVQREKYQSEALSLDLTEACEQGWPLWSAIGPFFVSLQKLVFGEVLLQKNRERNNSPTTNKNKHLRREGRRWSCFKATGFTAERRNNRQQIRRVFANGEGSRPGNVSLEVSAINCTPCYLHYNMPEFVRIQTELAVTKAPK
ncbi:uncharacterized protein LOC144608926 [Rhinoraja longicauda]